MDLERLGLIASESRLPIPGNGPQTAAEVLDRSSATVPDREALVGRHGRYTFLELDRAANRAASALGSLGVAPGDRVAVCLPNEADLVVAFYGAMRLGALFVGVNRPLAAPEKAYLLRDSGAKVLLAASDVLAQIEGEALPDLTHRVAADPGDAASPWTSRVAAGDETRPDVAIDPFAPAAIAYTSGTTGRPKGVVHSHRNLLLPGAVSLWRGHFSPDHRLGVVLPLTILNLIVLGPLTAHQVGSACIAIDRIDPVGLAAWIRNERVAHFAGVPTIFHDLLTHPDVKSSDLESLTMPMVGGAECPESFRELYRERFGRDVSIGYGMTEAPTAVTQSDGSLSPEPGLCGRALPQIEIRILDEDGRRLAPGEVGEICVAPARDGPFAGIYTPMLGYWGRPDETRRALRGDVYHSGDLGFLDEEGVLFIRGRRNELILRGGANVYPAEVERVLQSHPAVAEAAVLGLPDERLGQRVVAAVQLESHGTAGEEELRGHCLQQLARYKVPETIVLVDGLPRNAMNKVVKRELEALFSRPART